MDNTLISFMSDETMWIYAIRLLLGVSGLGIFTWWWVKAGRASSIYAFITFMLAGVIVTDGVHMWSRIMFHITEPPWLREHMFESWWWPKRYYLGTAALASLVFTAYRRALTRRTVHAPTCPCASCEYREDCDKFGAIIACKTNGVQK